jgi:3-isopropylmalate dehydratase small subunit
MVVDRTKLKKLLKEKGVKDLDDFNAFMREVSKDVMVKRSAWGCGSVRLSLPNTGSQLSMSSRTGE